METNVFIIIIKINILGDVKIFLTFLSHLKLHATTTNTAGKPPGDLDQPVGGRS
jgi:hypothetical protein